MSFLLCIFEAQNNRGNVVPQHIRLRRPYQLPVRVISAVPKSQRHATMPRVRQTSLREVRAHRLADQTQRLEVIRLLRDVELAGQLQAPELRVPQLLLVLQLVLVPAIRVERLLLDEFLRNRREVGLPVYLVEHLDYRVVDQVDVLVDLLRRAYEDLPVDVLVDGAFAVYLVPEGHCVVVLLVGLW